MSGESGAEGPKSGAGPETGAPVPGGRLEGKRVVLVNGARRKRNTYGLLRETAAFLEAEGALVEPLDLHAYAIGECLGCERCVRGAACPLRDDAEALMSRISSADGVVLASPVYMGAVTGRMKLFIDRTAAWFHRPVLVGKPSLVVATTAGSALSSTLAYLEGVAVQWGAVPAGRIGRTAQRLGERVSWREVARFIAALASPRERLSPGFGALMTYQVQRVLAEKVLENDRLHWREQGWADRTYYFDCRIGPAKRLAAGAFHALLSRRVEKTPEADLAGE
ncbi:MAG: flavodoxin family protein [Spirochaetaceae bacterium]|nr:flavodoxin family protein [Spirochaetaceae bacterium]